MKGWKLLCHDLKEGLWKKKGLYFFALFVAMLSGLELGNQITALKKVENLPGVGTLMDYWIYLIQGKEPYTFSLDTGYEFPMLWIGFYLFLLIAVNVHPSYDLEHWGYQMITRVKSRGKWWFSKCTWCFLCCLVYFGLTIFMTTLLAVADGAEMSLHPTWYAMEKFSNQKVTDLSVPLLLVVMVVLPCLMAYFISMLQMVLSLRLHSLVSFCIVNAIIMISTYAQSYFLPGNWGMPYRMDVITEGGLRIGNSLALLFVGIIVCILVGKVLFDRQDILEKASK